MSHHGNRYGRSEEARNAVLEAADDLLVERGFAGVTIEGIATRAGVAKQTIYRWWSSKVDILLDTFIQDMAESLTPRDHGDVRRDLRVHLHKVALFLTRADAGAVLRALIGHAQHDPAMAARLRTDYLSQQRARDLLPLERAVARGELPSSLDIEAALDELLGPVYYRVLVTGEPVSRGFTDQIIEGFLARYGIS